MYGMNPNFNPADPSALVPGQILPHLHLVSSYRFPSLASLAPQQALEFLNKCPTIVKDAQPVAWTYFAAPPPDGTVLLTWQPPRMGTTFATDGLVWADPEMAYDMAIGPYQLQILVHRSGFHYPNEPVATHARSRFRILKGPGQVDPNLWVVHYSTAEPASRIPSGQIQIPREVHQLIQVRAQVEAQGQLVRKEFMFPDRANWPKVDFTHAPAQQPPYYNPLQPGRAYNQPPPNKRARPAVPPQRQAIPSAMGDTSLEEEENSTQDAFDFITPREISQSRYKQHHEWMEEIFSSPYAVGKILPIDLGLGLMGELEPLTAGILDAPGGDYPNRQGSKEKYEVKSYAKLTPEKMKEFEARVAEYTKKEESELEKMKAAHAKKMADLKRSRTYMKAERRLRDIPRTESLRSPDDASTNAGTDPLDGIVNDLENSLGVAFDTKKSVVCVNKGGYIEEHPAPPRKAHQVNGGGPMQPIRGNGSNALFDSLDADNSAASLLDQYGSNSLTGTPGGSLSIPGLSQPQSRSQSAVATPSAPVVEPQHHVNMTAQSTSAATRSPDDLLDLDVEMSGMANTQDKSGENEWVMVDQASDAQQPTHNEQSTTRTHDVSSTSLAGGEGTAGMFNTADFGSFDNLVDSAGDALADYTNVDDDLGLDLVNDSAFGDAFHEGMHHSETADGDNQ